MIKSDPVRLAKLQGLLEKLKRGETVQNKVLKTWLGEDGYAEYEALLSHSAWIRDYLDRKPDGKREYEAILKKGDLLYSRAIVALDRGQKSARKLIHKSESVFEGALERLEEMLSEDPSLEPWLDRPCVFGVKGKLSISPGGVPRFKTSRSAHRESDSNIDVKTKRQCKIEAVEAAIRDIQNPASEKTQDPSSFRPVDDRWAKSLARAKKLGNTLR